MDNSPYDFNEALVGYRDMMYESVARAFGGNDDAMDVEEQRTGPKQTDQPDVHMDI